MNLGGCRWSVLLLEPPGLVSAQDAPSQREAIVLETLWKDVIEELRGRLGGRSHLRSSKVVEYYPTFSHSLTRAVFFFFFFFFFSFFFSFISQNIHISRKSEILKMTRGKRTSSHGSACSFPFADCRHRISQFEVIIVASVI